jgi:hypothetical protein
LPRPSVYITLGRFRQVLVITKNGSHALPQTW